ncbi:iron uptake system protein EfeO [Tessaracoccus palaemonis]|uniref:EfeM/EfeO family lipoprotein n=1 Tax=Tessaracoccus palaemonis TaxID=2829499 RepID=A0ABX8SKW8_9ACTN|nr:iron uptake system protein EfeO [Tessaracoccus palaemonis]QXT64012.1 EfeM/EfeO family lipoprotein [Tessaracoccus palaemonis]
MATSWTVLSTTLLAGAAVALTGCVENQPAADGTTAAEVIAVTSTDDACEVSQATHASGATSFSITNSGDQITEFYVLADDHLRIVSERENIAPGQEASLTVTLQPGTYYTACKPGMRGANVGEAEFTVTGDEVELSGEDQELFDQAVADYINFVKDQVAELQPQAEKFVDAYVGGDDDTARELYAQVRVPYERIEPVAETLGVLDPRIDYREIDYLAEADLLEQDDPTFTQWLGFHRIEKDLWPPADGDLQPDGSSALEGWEPSDDATRKELGDTLVADVDKLYDAVHDPDFIADQQITIATVSNGAMGLLEEIAVGKVTGEENWWSHKDLWDFQANLEGSRIAFDLVAPIAERKGDEGKELVSEISDAYAALETELATYGSLDEGFVSYDTVDDAGRKELTAKLDAVREPLSRLTNAVLGIS